MKHVNVEPSKGKIGIHWELFSHVLWNDGANLYIASRYAASALPEAVYRFLFCSQDCKKNGINSWPKSSCFTCKTHATVHDSPKAPVIGSRSVFHRTARWGSSTEAAFKYRARSPPDDRRSGKSETVRPNWLFRRVGLGMAMAWDGHGHGMESRIYLGMLLPCKVLDQTYVNFKSRQS